MYVRQLTRGGRWGVAHQFERPDTSDLTVRCGAEITDQERKSYPDPAAVKSGKVRPCKSCQRGQK